MAFLTLFIFLISLFSVNAYKNPLVPSFSNHVVKLQNLNQKHGGSNQKLSDGQYPPEVAWNKISDMGKVLSDTSNNVLFSRYVVTGMIFGLGGILTASVGFDMGVNPYLPGNGAQRFLCGAIGFPLSNLILKSIGFGSWTGDMLKVMLAIFKKKTSFLQLLRVLITAYLGSAVGSIIMSFIVKYAGLPAILPIITISQSKISKTFLKSIFRGILGGFLICLSAFLSATSGSTSGKILSIWFPISSYVICDFEHYLSTFFFLFCGYLNGSPISFNKAAWVVLGSTIGNLIGAFLMACLGHYKIGADQVVTDERHIMIT